MSLKKLLHLEKITASRQHTHKKCLRCTTRYNSGAFMTLPSISVDRYPADKWGPEQVNVWRKCACGNSLVVDFKDPRWAKFAAECTLIASLVRYFSEKKGKAQK